MPEVISSKLLDATLQKNPLSHPPIPVYHTLADLEKFYGIVPTAETIGEGSYSIVKKVKHPVTGIEYALKFVSYTSSEAEIVAANEVKMLQTINHQGNHANIIFLHGLFELETGVGLLLDLCSEGDLFDFLHGHHQELSIHLTQSISYQFFNAIKFLHDSEIVHRDLKLENILIHHIIRAPTPPNVECSFSAVPITMHIKLSDFGFARKLQKGEELEERSGSIEYSSPEIILGKPHNPYFSDLWSAGIVFYALITGVLPFNEMERDVVLESKPTSSDTNCGLTRKKSLVKAGRKSLLHRIARVDYFLPEPPPVQYTGEVLLNSDTHALIENLLCRHPEERFTASQVLDVPWVAQGKVA